MTRFAITAAAMLAASAASPGFAQTTNPPQPATIQEPLSPDGVRTVQQQLRVSGFYHGPIDGRWGRATEAAIGAYQESRRLQITWQLDPATVRALELNPQLLTAPAPAGPSGQVLPRDVVRRIQDRLARAGFNPGRDDGVWGSRTAAAMRDFQQARGLQATGDLNPMTAQALGLNPANLSN